MSSLTLKEAKALMENPTQIGAMRSLLQTSYDALVAWGIDPTKRTDYQSRSQIHHSDVLHPDLKKELLGHLATWHRISDQINDIDQCIRGEAIDFLGQPYSVGDEVVYPCSVGSHSLAVRRGVVTAINPNGGIQIRPTTSPWRHEVGKEVEDQKTVTVGVNACYITCVTKLIEGAK